MAIGDHLVIQYLAFQHHGIDLGDGTVIEYGGKGTGRMSVRRVHLREFLSRGPAFVRPYPPGTALHPSQTVELAWARLREQRYDLFNNNCEHLAYWCKTGRHWSPQAESLRGFIATGVVVAAIALLAGATG
jgi:hypothetical protein